MKLLVMFPLVMMATIAVQSQSKSLDPILVGYFEVKNALVKDDARLASEQALKLEVMLTNFESSKLETEVQKIFVQKKGKMLQHLRALANSNEIESQRTQLADLSEALWELIKNAEHVRITVYHDYFPMKKASWLSEEAAIKNPYYGKKMLSCGKVQKKIN